MPTLETYQKAQKNGDGFRVAHDGKSKIKIIKSLLTNEHSCKYSIFLTKFPRIDATKFI